MAAGPVLEAVIFDMDGLLIDSEPIWAEAEERFLARHGKTFDAAISSLFIGMRNSDALPVMKREYGLAEPIEALSSEWVEEFLGLCQSKLPLRPGADQIIRELYQTHRLAIASSSPRAVIEQVVTVFGWTQYISAICAGEEVRCGKPAPDIFLRAAEQLGAAPTSCVVLEDSLAGVKAAKAAGMLCFAVPSRELFKVEEFTEADAIFDSLIEVKKAILGTHGSTATEQGKTGRRST